MSDVNTAAYWQMQCKLKDEENRRLMRLLEEEASHRSDADSENKRLREELRLYEAALKLACDAATDWGQYAGEYFQNKWNLKADGDPDTHLQEARERLAAAKTEP